ncbi:minor capsid protein [Pediococcus acidilactici]|uniref:phage tail terminator protein n=1 Tax=Pediococcus acidilactici TaxID=1254 RepID=UPI00237FC5D8|nr:minor capsid protein [Pediococcus acidilactici]WDV24869.1 minor capsid protein [Pediococcus acidilactici]WEE13934.1 minor capsid protein [Pediococcus acidilactici]
MDLILRLVETINDQCDLPYPVIAGYLKPGECIGLVPDPGSSTIGEDWAGNKTKRMNYTIAMRTKDAGQADKFMWEISNFLEMSDDIPSADDSYIFEQIEQTGLPSMSEQDEQGYTDYMLNFFVQIITNTRK